MGLDGLARILFEMNEISLGSTSSSSFLVVMHSKYKLCDGSHLRFFHAVTCQQHPPAERPCIERSSTTWPIPWNRSCFMINASH